MNWKVRISTSAFLLFFGAVGASRVSYAVDPVKSAKSVKCLELALDLETSVATGEGEIIYPEGNLTASFRKSAGGTESMRAEPATLVMKPVHLERVDSWGDPVEVQGKYARVVIPVESVDEGYEIFSQIARHLAGVPSEEPRPPAPGMVAFEIPGRVYAYVRGPEDRAAHTYKNLIIEYPRDSRKIEESRGVVHALLAMGMSSADHAIHFPLTTNSLRHDWGYYSFQSWAKSLNYEESLAFEKIGTAGYREIHDYLRNHRASRPEMDQVIHVLDRAIDRAQVNREVTVYRADRNPALMQLWEKVAAQTDGVHVSLPVDKAYTFTTLDPAVADMWNRTQLKQPGVLLEIKVPEGSKAAYLDAQGRLKNRGYLELLLPRESKFQATDAYTREDGQRVLKVDLLP